VIGITSHFFFFLCRRVDGEIASGLLRPGGQTAVVPNLL
jgi:hypothetical protein